MTSCIRGRIHGQRSSATGACEDLPREQMAEAIAFFRARQGCGTASGSGTGRTLRRRRSRCSRRATQRSGSERAACGRPDKPSRQRRRSSERVHGLAPRRPPHRARQVRRCPGRAAFADLRFDVPVPRQRPSAGGRPHLSISAGRLRPADRDSKLTAEQVGELQPLQHSTVRLRLDEEAAAFVEHLGNQSAASHGSVPGE